MTPKHITQKDAQKIIRTAYGQRRTFFARSPLNPLRWRCIINGRAFEGRTIREILFQDEVTRYELQKLAERLISGKRRHQEEFHPTN